ncbi:MAG: heavy metal-binding domain-containing protein [Candidatus Accumulibacter sp.]|jgi:uncharacterized protein YbjQ (UPF0145 family)|nr:heavy metal-binding domain-containing protein [Accumulibacter sp.]
MFIRIFALALALGFSTQGFARDERQMFPLKDALNSAEAKERLDPKVRLFFGARKYPAVAKDFGEWRTNKKTNGFNKSDKEACEWAFLSAVLELQERAKKLGANAIVGIKSNYKNAERSSQTEYMCGSGALMSGVALKGKVVSIRK